MQQRRRMRELRGRDVGPDRPDEHHRSRRHILGELDEDRTRDVVDEVEIVDGETPWPWRRDLQQRCEHHSRLHRACQRIVGRTDAVAEEVGPHECRPPAESRVEPIDVGEEPTDRVDGVSRRAAGQVTGGVGNGPIGRRPLERVGGHDRCGRPGKVGQFVDELGGAHPRFAGDHHAASLAIGGVLPRRRQLLPLDGAGPSHSKW